ncbi:MAG TPA: hypothetical protein VEZ16_14685 [Microvirga sp.]|nr:hypothetical protein [Microvirga sp.]
MPVLDAKALKKDPKGAAFLLSVLRRSPTPPPEEQARLPAPQIRLGKRRDEIFQGTPTGA